jgi:hypothetical protein
MKQSHHLSDSSFLADKNGIYVSDNALATNTTNSDGDPHPSVLESARIFPQKSSYNIPVATPGEVYLRLWFYPNTSVQSQQNYNPATSMISVTANGYAL